MRKRDLKNISSYTAGALQGIWRAKKKARGFEPSGELGHVSLNIEVPARQSTKMHATGSVGIKVRTDSEPAAADVAHLRSISAADADRAQGGGTASAASREPEGDQVGPARNW